MHIVGVPVGTLSDKNRLPSSSSNSSVLIAHTRTETIIDRSSPYNIIETTNDNDDEQSIDNDNVLINEQENEIEGKIRHSNLSSTSSLTSGTDIYMDAVEILSDENQNDKSS